MISLAAVLSSHPPVSSYYIKLTPIRPAVIIFFTKFAVFAAAFIPKPRLNLSRRSCALFVVVFAK